MLHGCYKYWQIAIILLTSLSTLLAGPRFSSRIVETKSGAIRGVILELNSRHLEPVEVFRGVPYAAPPVGRLRYRPPELPLAWSGTRLADEFGAVCPQSYPDVSNRTAALLHMPKGRYTYLRKLVPLLVNQSEDCLFLNIYVPGNGNRGLDAPYAVMLFVHGESFEWGAGNPYDGSVLASYGHVIFITVNFRLGILGFLKTRLGPTRADDSGGNLALKDLTAALRWVQENIAAFGGDPARVTVLGHDTGAALTNLLLISSRAKGLFRRVILLSGTAVSPWATVHNPDSLRRAVGLQTGCLHADITSSAAATATSDVEDIAPCLRSRSLQELLDIRLEAPRFMPRFAPSLPVDDITADPAHAMEHASDTFIACDLMLGASTTESYNDFSASDIQYGFEEDQRNRVIRTYIRNAYVYHLNEIFSAVRNEYTDWEKPVQHPINIRDSTMEALSDGHTVSPLIKVAYVHARRGAKTYFFHFGYQTKDSEYPQRLGSVRGEDITYITGLPLVSGSPHFAHNFSRQDMGVAEALLNFFTNFAKTGDPNEPRAHQTDYGTVKEKTRYRGLTWDTYETGTQLYLSITAKPKMKSHYRGHKMALWLNLIPQLHQPGNEDVSMRHHHFHEREQHYYAGTVRAESYTRLPPALHPASIMDSKTECVTVTTTEDDFLLLDDEDDVELLHRLASKHYYSYAAALAITIGVGCLLLLLNMIIFAGIYYQKGRDRKHKRSSRSNSSPSSEDIQMSMRSTTSPGSSSKHHSPATEKHVIKIYEPPPCYNNVTMSPRDGSKKRERPVPPVRSSSNPPDVTIKKRVQVQEISV
ncbi:Neuroligin 2 [Carabus blaptoides fortunei]